jgi:hypothetical protein
MSKRHLLVLALFAAAVASLVVLQSYRGEQSGNEVHQEVVRNQLTPDQEADPPTLVPNPQNGAPDDQALSSDKLITDDHVHPQGDLLHLGEPPEIGEELPAPAAYQMNQASLSPDGGRIVYRYYVQSEGTNNIVIQDISTGENKVLIREDAGSGAIVDIQWLPDGQRLAFVRLYYEGIMEDPTYSVGVIDSESGEMKTVMESDSDELRMVGTTENEIVLVNRGPLKGNLMSQEVHAISPDGTETRSLGSFQIEIGTDQFSYGHEFFRLRPASRDLFYLRSEYRKRSPGVLGSRIMRVSLDNLEAGPEEWAIPPEIGLAGGFRWNSEGEVMGIDSDEGLFVLFDGDSPELKQLLKSESRKISVRSFVGDDIVFFAPPRDRQVMLSSETSEKAWRVPYIYSLGDEDK